MKTQSQKMYMMIKQLKLLEELTEKDTDKTIKTSSNNYLAIQLVEENSFFKVIRLSSFVETKSKAKLEYELEIRVWKNNIAEGVSLIQPSLGIEKQAYRRRSGFELPKKVNQMEINNFLMDQLRILSTHN